MFSVYLFGADPEKLRHRFANDDSMLPEIASRIKRRHNAPPDEVDKLCVRVNAVRSLSWPNPGDMLSVNAFLWMLDYAAEPIVCARLRDIRDSSLVNEIPFIREMTAEPGPLPVPDAGKLPCEIGFLCPQQLRESAERELSASPNPQLDVGTELIEVFESLADDRLSLYTIVDGAKLA